MFFSSERAPAVFDVFNGKTHTLRMRAMSGDSPFGFRTIIIDGLNESTAIAARLELKCRSVCSVQKSFTGRNKTVLIGVFVRRCE